MNILFLDQFSQLRGGQRCFLQLLPALRERGWHVMAALPENGPLTSNFPCTPIPCGPYRSGTKSLGDIIRFVGDIRRQREIISGLLDRHSFDLMYVNGPRVLTSAALANNGRIPMLFHAHNFLDRSYSARIAGASIRRGVSRVVACSEFVAGP